MNSKVDELDLNTPFQNLSTSFMICSDESPFGGFKNNNAVQNFCWGLCSTSAFESNRNIPVRNLLNTAWTSTKTDEHYFLVESVNLQDFEKSFGKGYFVRVPITYNEESNMKFTCWNDLCIYYKYIDCIFTTSPVVYKENRRDFPWEDVPMDYESSPVAYFGIGTSNPNDVNLILENVA